MRSSEHLPITAGVQIPLAELTFRATPASGPGGQHVNRSSTRIELWWDAARSPSLSEEQRARVLTRLGARVTADGMLRLVASATRSQARNRAEAIERFQELLATALKVVRVRKKTRPSRAAKERRLVEKKQRAARKQDRRRPGTDD